MGAGADRGPQQGGHMTPAFLPHTTLDAIGALGDAGKGRERLRQLRDLAIADGAQVLLLVWPRLEWVLLAVEVPAGVVVEDAAQLIPNLLANPDALERMQRSARTGHHLQWLQLLRPAAAIH
jgi:hypothetical protein